MKHTHNGHCQLCSRLQAVNVKNNRVAKHGYSVDYGFFNGVCPGADNLPYEMSADLLPSIIKSLKDQAESLKIKAAAVPATIPATYNTNTHVFGSGNGTITKNVDGTFTITKFKRQNAYDVVANKAKIIDYTKDGIEYLKSIYSDTEYWTDKKLQKRLDEEWKSCVDGEVSSLLNKAKRQLDFADHLQKRFDAFVPNQPLIPAEVAPKQLEVVAGMKFVAHDRNWEVLKITTDYKNGRNVTVALCQREGKERFYKTLREVRKYIEGK